MFARKYPCRYARGRRTPISNTHKRTDDIPVISVFLLQLFDAIQCILVISGLALLLIQVGGFPKICDGSCLIPLGRMGAPPIVVSIGILRIEGKGLGIVRDGASEVA